MYIHIHIFIMHRRKRASGPPANFATTPIGTRCSTLRCDERVRNRCIEEN